MKIYHASDIHLGRKRLDGLLPEQDMAAAFRYIVETAIADHADVFLLAGDLFDQPQVEPGHLRQAQEILQLLRGANIPVVAIEGNHDKVFVHSEQDTWVGYLAEDGLLQLLRPQFGSEGAIPHSWDPATRRGCYVDHGGVRFVGGGYLGAATPAKVRQLLATLSDPMPHVLLLHAGPDYFVGEGGGFSQEDLAAMREKISYLALGHIHKPMAYEGWACNPGSPENCQLREASYGKDSTGADTGRGYAVVEFDLSGGNKPTSIQIRSNPRRSVHRADLDCTPFGNKLKDGVGALVKAAVKLIGNLDPKPEAVIDIRLVGELNLNRIALDQARVSAEIAAAAKVFAVALDPSHLNLAEIGAANGEAADATLSREELEKQAILKIVSETPLWGLGEEHQAFASLFFDLKEAVRGHKEPQALAEMIANSALVEKIRLAKETPAATEPAGDAAKEEVTP